MLIRIRLLLFLIGSVSFQVFAGKDLQEDEAVTDGIKEGDSPELAEEPTLFSMITGSIPYQDLMTPDSATSTSEYAENSTDPGIPEISEEGLETAALVGIIIGIIVAIGVATAIIITVVKKVSGRF